MTEDQIDQATTALMTQIKCDIKGDTGNIKSHNGDTKGHIDDGKGHTDDIKGHTGDVKSHTDPEASTELKNEAVPQEEINTEQDGPALKVVAKD